jgi:transcription initiation factor TFIID subunit 13
MTEPRARAARHKNGLNFGKDLENLLFASGSPTHPDLLHPHPQTSQNYLATLPTPNKEHPPTPFTEPFPETVRVLDEILTDFIIETCHNAVAIASYSGRTKLKLADFEWVLRKDAMKLGRVSEMFRKEKELKDKRKVGDTGAGGKLAVNELIELGGVAGEEGTGKGKGRGRGRRKKRGIDEVDGDGVGGDEGDGEERGSKKAKSEVG